MSNTLTAVTGCYTAMTSATAASTSAANAVLTATIATQSASTSFGSNVYSIGSITTSPTITLGSNEVSGEVSVFGPDAVIRTDKGDIRLDVLFDIVQKAEQILCRIRADMERIEEYPALQAAYDHYRVIDKLCQDDPSVSDRR